MSKINVFDRIMKLDFHSEFIPLLRLIEDNLDRVEFVKDHVGLSDFLFIAEKKAEKYDFPCFACFDLDIKDNNEQNFLSMNQSLVYDPNEIYNDLLNFFENSKDTFYLEIGFEESIPTQEVNFKVYKMLKNKEYNDIQEAISKTRTFPSWYKAKHAKEVQEQFKYMNELEMADKRLLFNLKYDLEKSINDAIMNDDFNTFIKLTSKYLNVCYEIENDVFEKNKKRL